MKSALLARLEVTMGSWIDDNCDDETVWPNCFVGEDTSSLMAQAAAAVFDAIVEFQDYAKCEGLFTQSR